ncbi:MAG: LytTR family transcriptional regulator DNA-binding domain-containing protein, partial [Ignavibacteria bacterium]|nr:LytTR family transcriptional regulator DNA-binding domain-containing protein [Ignavibacteria bacterium]
LGFALVALYFKIGSLESLTLFRSGALALLPLVLFNLMNYNHTLKTKVVKAIDSGRHWFDEQQEKERIAIMKENIVLTSENGKDIFEENIKNILLIQSAGNYVEVFYRKDNDIKRQIIRQTLSNIEIQVVDYPTLLKCHRRCLVNTEQVKRFGGTSPNFTLEVEGLDFRIPVSRQKAAELRKLFTKK